MAAPEKWLRGDERKALVLKLSVALASWAQDDKLRTLFGDERGGSFDTYKHSNPNSLAEHVIDRCEEWLANGDRSGFLALARLDPTEASPAWLDRLPPEPSNVPSTIDEVRHLAVDRKEQWQKLTELLWKDSAAHVLFLSGRTKEGQPFFMERLRRSFETPPENPEDRFPFDVRVRDVNWAIEGVPPSDDDGFASALLRALYPEDGGTYKSENAAAALEAELARLTKQNTRLVFLHDLELSLEDYKKCMDDLKHYYTELLPRWLAPAFNSFSVAGPIFLQVVTWGRDPLARLVNQPRVRWWMRSLKQKTRELKRYQVDSLPDFDPIPEQDLRSFLETECHFPRDEARDIARAAVARVNNTNDALQKLRNIIGTRPRGSTSSKEQMR